jgi:hypothetical protein
MLEAKVALKCLFELLVDSKRELQNQSEKGFQARYEEIKEAHDRLAMEFETNKSEYEQQLAVIKMQNEQKVSPSSYVYIDSKIDTILLIILELELCSS